MKTRFESNRVHRLGMIDIFSTFDCQTRMPLKTKDRRKLILEACVRIADVITIDIRHIQVNAFCIAKRIETEKNSVDAKATRECRTTTYPRPPNDVHSWKNRENTFELIELYFVIVEIGDRLAE